MLRTTWFNNALTLFFRAAHNTLVPIQELIVTFVRKPCVITCFALLGTCFVCIATYHAHIRSFDRTNHILAVYNNPHVIKDVHLFNKVRTSRKLVHVYLCIIGRHRDTAKDSQCQNQRENEGKITFHNLNLLMFFSFFAGVRVCCQG